MRAGRWIMGFFIGMWALSGCGGTPTAPGESGGGIAEAGEMGSGPRWMTPEGTAIPVPPVTGDPILQPQPGQTEVPPAAPGIDAAGPEQPLLAWAVAPDDGSVYVLDAEPRLYKLEGRTLKVLARSDPLFPGAGRPGWGEARTYMSDYFYYCAPQLCAPAYLAVAEQLLFISNLNNGQTLILNRADLQPVGTLGMAGALALDPGRRLFMLVQDKERQTATLWAYNVGNWAQAPEVVIAPTEGVGPIWPAVMAVDPVSRRLYVSLYGHSGPHEFGTGRVYDLDTLLPGDRSAQFSGQLGWISAASGRGLAAVVEQSNSGFLGSSLKLINVEGQKLLEVHPLEGVPLLDPSGPWLYLLGPAGLWVMRTDDLSLQRAVPWLDSRPLDLGLSPDGGMLYLFGNGWLRAVETAALREGRVGALHYRPEGPFQDPPHCSECGNLRTASVYPSPTFEQDQTVYLAFSYGDLYRSTDGGQQWEFLPALRYPDFKYIFSYSFSPNFAVDHTMIALGTAEDEIYRSTDGGETWEAWAPPIAFTSDRDGNREIYRAASDGSAILRVTQHGAEDETPAWSPAWTSLAYQSRRTGDWNIFVQPAECAAGADCPLQQLTDNPADDMLPAWSPDGRRIAFVSTQDGNPELYVMDTDGGNPQRLTFNPGGDWRPAWREDSRRLVYTCDRGGNHDICQLTVPEPGTPATASEPVVVVQGAGEDQDPAVVANHLAYLSRTGETPSRVYVFYTSTGDLSAPPPEGGSFTAVTPDGPTASHPAWFGSDPYRGFLLGLEQEGNVDLYLGNLSGELKPLIVSPAFEGQPAWGPPAWIPEKFSQR